MRRLHPTLADYLVIAVSPALIMVLIGSLIHFLLDVFYEGQHSDRLGLVLSLFIFAAVLIGRISIEMGYEHAMMYALPLALVTAIALNRFVVYRGGALSAYSGIINIALMALIWWCAHKLTWDCTFIDESADPSGEGLLRFAGLEKGKEDQLPAQVRASGDLEGVTAGDELPRPWWERLLSPRPRPHAPGVWIIYFSLGALPLFGIGQWFIPAGSVERRRYGFAMLFIYVACALGLLLCTSFLGLRRYLRERRLQMPPAMAGLWIGIGCFLIVALLGAAALLPRPNAEYAISQVPWKMTSPERGSSRYAMGRDAAEKDAQGSPTGQDQRPPEEQKKDLQPTGGSEGTKPSGAQGPGKTQGKSGGGQGKSQGEQGKSQGEQGKSRPGDDGSGSKDSGRDGGGGKGRDKGQEKGGGSERDSSGQQGEGERGKGEPDAGKKGDSQEPNQDGSKGAGKDSPPDKTGRSGTGTKQAERPPGSGSGSAAQRPKPSGEPPKSPDENRPPSGPKTPSAGSPPQLQRALESVGPLLKWLFYGALILIAAYWCWRSREQLAAALRNLLEGWRQFWSWLFGRKAKETAVAAGEEPMASPPPTRRFADFVDPFAAGTADRFTPDELIRYSFEALEAWACENGSPREPDQTAYEFAEQVAARVESLSRDARTLAELYNKAAYAPGTLPARSTRPLAQFWENLRSEVVRAGTAGAPAAVSPPGPGG